MIERRELLMRLARKYIWWKTPEDAVAMPERVMAQVMDIGDYLDVQELAKAVGEDALREVIVHAQAGQFNERSWAYWNYRLGWVVSITLRLCRCGGSRDRHLSCLSNFRMSR